MKIIDFTKKYADLIIVLGIATFLRLRDVVKYDLWFDEAYTGLMMRAPRELFNIELAKDPHPPLYYLLNRGLTQVLGVGDLTIKLLSVIPGILIVAVAYVALKKVLNKEAAVFGAFLLAINPFLIAYSTEARSYSLYGLITLVAYTALIYKKQAVFFGSLIMLCFTHYIGLLYAGLLFLLYLAQNKADVKAAIKKDYLGVGGIALTTVYSLGQVVRGQTGEAWWLPNANLTSMLNSVSAYFLGVKPKIQGVTPLNELSLPISTQVWGTLIAILLMIGLFAAVKKHKSLPQELGGLLLLYLGPQLILILYNLVLDKTLYLDRYILPSAIFAVLTATYVITKTLRLEATIVIIALYALLTAQILPPDYHTGMRDLAANLKDVNTEIVLTSPGEFVIAKYYLWETEDRLRLYDPEHPTNTYQGWPFINKDYSPTEPKSALYISPYETRLPEETFEKFSLREDLGNYMIFKKRDEL